MLVAFIEVVTGDPPLRRNFSAVILNDLSYGTERSYNGLRLAGSLAKRDREQVRAFLIGDACRRSSLDELTERTRAADGVLVF